MTSEPRGAAGRRLAKESAPRDQRRGMWDIHITHPGYQGLIPAKSSRHRPTILARVVDEPKWHLLYRGACIDCDYEGDERRKELEAVEDAHDHTHPEWRSLPGVEPPPERFRHDPKPYDRWFAAVTKAYPAGWLDCGGPIVTVRKETSGPRPIPGGAPGGGYDIAATYKKRKKRIPGPPQPMLELEI
ncbi:DUF6349 family protein [Planotetraspora phitsanulokensis]|uniref:Uncharacterized protein n=2 Tax=Planotetraspora phitsanulokensis TaxID=575192 RepID=A0A8J3XIZ0_9ACTN|nr:DUF6349 family protein [Planotetraspora phitsanulokensis]GII42874.1 hypothetical protein Pph01_78770 [Planotetraspora phitsanulokensis]